MKRNTPELLDRAPPHDHEAERAILAVALTHPETFKEIVCAMTPQDFDGYRERKIYGAMAKLHAFGKPIDITLLVGALRDESDYNADKGVCATTLVNLYRLFPMYTNLKWYIARVKEMSRRRIARNRGEKLIQAAHSGMAGESLPPAIRRARRQVG